MASVIPDRISNMQSLIKAADDELYVSKTAGGDKVSMPEALKQEQNDPYKLIA
ncbi:MAG: hypothetical protein AAF512_25150 [Pseudomonadota bacterium]